MKIHSFLLVSLLIFVNYVSNSPLETSCTVSHYDDVAAAAKSCSTLTLKNIEVPAKTTMKIALKKGAKLIFDGHITHVPVAFDGDLIELDGTNVEVTGTSNHLIDGLGPKHWKGRVNETTVTRPQLLRLKLTNSTVKHLHLKNCPNHCILMHSSHLVVSNILIDNKDGYPAKAGNLVGTNTDGFDVGSCDNIRIENSVVYNQDDCVAVSAGAHSIEIDNLWCNGSHGLSLTVGHDEVHDVVFKNSYLQYAANALHIKTHNQGTTGHIYNVIYSNITFKDITGKAINIQQNYPSGKARGNIPITKLTLKDIKGTMKGSNTEAISIICAEGACSDWKWRNVKITGAKRKDVCENVPHGISC